MKLDEIPSNKYPPLSTGSLGLDIQLRRPMSVGIHEIYGGYGSGKSTIAMHVCAAARKKDYPVLYVDFERALTNEFIERFKELDASDPDFVVDRPTVGNDALNRVIDFFKGTENGVVVFDSIPCAAATEKLIADDVAKCSVASLASLLTKFLVIVNPLIHDKGGRLILLNQIRDKNVGGNKFTKISNPNKTPGGNALHHFTNSRIYLSGEWHKSNEIVVNTKTKSGKDSGSVVGKFVQAIVEKNRHATPGRAVKIPIYGSCGINKVLEVLRLSIDFGIIAKKGAWYYYNEDLLGQGELQVLEKLSEDMELLRELELKIYDIVDFNEI
jgi:recombination protein RecA